MTMSLSMLQYNCDPLDLDVFINVYSSFCGKSIEELLGGDDWLTTWYTVQVSNPKTLKVLYLRGSFCVALTLKIIFCNFDINLRTSTLTPLDVPLLVCARRCCAGE